MLYLLAFCFVYLSERGGVNKRNWNWMLWAGFLLALLAPITYLKVFVNFPWTRDFPWGSAAMFALAAVLLILGIRRASSRPDLYRGKIAGPVLAVLSSAICGFFAFGLIHASAGLPSSAGSPRIGQKVPDFTLADTHNKQVSLHDLLSAPIGNTAPKGALLIFYRGYW